MQSNGFFSKRKYQKGINFADDYIKMVSLMISPTVGWGNTTRSSSLAVIPRSMAMQALLMISLQGLPSMCTPSMCLVALSVIILHKPSPPSFSATKRPE